MAIWTIRDESVPQLAPQKSRSPGLHLTDVLKRLESYQLSLTGKSVPDEPYEHSLYAEFGNEFEWAFKARMDELYPGRFIDPGEMCANVGTDDNPIPLYLTPDLFELRKNLDWVNEPDVVRVIDFKWTTKSLDRWDPRLESPATQYIRNQLKGYCKVANTHYGGFIIRYFRGNYADKQIDHLSVNVEFETWEIESLWADVITMARQMKQWKL